MHDHFITLQRAMRNSIRPQSDPAGQIINLTFKHLNKNLNSVLTKNKIDKKALHNQLDEFYRKIKSSFSRHPQTSGLIRRRMQI